MAVEPRPAGQNAQPPGVEGEGQDPYPTYRDGQAVPHAATATKPTDIGLPASQRTYALPMLIGLIVFALIILVSVIWGGMNVARTSGEPGAVDAPSGATADQPTPAP